MKDQSKFSNSYMEAISLLVLNHITYFFIFQVFCGYIIAINWFFF